MQDLSYFPYKTIRPQQKQIMNFIKQSFKNNQIAVFEAATGIGKTIAALSAVLEYLYNHNSEADDDGRLKLVFAGRTHSQADRVIEELRKIDFDHKKSINGLSKRGRRSLCINNEVLSNSNSSTFIPICTAYQKSRRCKPFVNALSEHARDFAKEFVTVPTTSATIYEESDDHGYCPSIITNYAIKHVDIISCSYHYIFNQEIRHRFLRSLDVDPDQIVLVVDECHNLPSAVADMNTNRLSLNQVQQCLAEMRKYHIKNKSNGKSVYAVIQALELLLKQVSEETDISMYKFLTTLEKIKSGMGCNRLINIEFVNDMLELGEDLVSQRVEKHFSYLSMVAKVLLFGLKNMSKADLLIILNRYKEMSYLTIKLFNPSSIIGYTLQSANQVVLMSGTIGSSGIFMSQVGIFVKNYGNNKTGRILKLPSPYQQELGVYLVEGVNTKYNNRNAELYGKYARIITDIISCGKNVGLYVPSYTILNKLFDAGLETTSVPFFRAESGMTSQQSATMIENFRKYKNKGGAHAW